MTAIPQQETIVQYITNSAQTAYTFAFYAPLPTDIDVYYQAANATAVPANDILSINNDYTVSYNPDPITGGTITLLFTPTTGFYLTINRNVQDSLNTNFSNAQNFSGANLDAALDRLLLLCQQNKNYTLERNLSYIINNYLPAAEPFTQLPVLQNLQVWMGSADGVIAATFEENPDVSVLRSQLENASPGTNGAGIIGYFDVVNSVSTNVSDFLNGIVGLISTQLSTQLIQPGFMQWYAGTVVPTGWLPCDGSAVSRITYANLFAAIGITWGAGDTITTFNVPDYRRRVPVGVGGTGNAVLGNAVGNVGGEDAHTQTIAEMPSHDHSTTNTQNFVTFSGTGLNAAGAGAGFDSIPATNVRGGGNPFNVIQKSAVATMMIKT